MIAFLHAWLPFDKRVVWHDNQIIAYLQIGISTDVTMNSGALRIKHALQFVANTFADGEPDNCAIRAVDEHVVDRPKKPSAAGHHFVTDHVGHARQIIEIAGRAVFHRRSKHEHIALETNVELLAPDQLKNDRRGGERRNSKSYANTF